MAVLFMEKLSASKSNKKHKLWELPPGTVFRFGGRDYVKMDNDIEPVTDGFRVASAGAMDLVEFCHCKFDTEVTVEVENIASFAKMTVEYPK